MTPQIIAIIFLSIATIGLLVIAVILICLVEDLRIERVKLKTELSKLYVAWAQSRSRQQSEMYAKQ